LSRATSLSNLPFRSSVRFAVANPPKTQLRYLWAALALCAAIITATPGYSDSRTNHPDAKDSAAASTQLDGRTQFENQTTHISVSATVLPNKKTLMARWVAYNPDSCAQISSGSWKINSAPKYGTISTGLNVLRFTAGHCAGHSYSFRAIYYTWTKTKNKPEPKEDKFVATWTGGPFKYDETFSLKLK
jgi:hypothetical protein